MPHSHSLFSLGRPLQLYALLAKYALTPHAIPSASALTKSLLDIRKRRLVLENICTMHYSGCLMVALYSLHTPCQVCVLDLCFFSICVRFDVLLQ